MVAGILVVLAIYTFTTLAFAAEEAFPGTGEAAKRLALDSGTWGTLLALALAAVVTEFGLLMRSNGKIAAVTEKARADAAEKATEYAKEFAEQQEAFSRERAEWHAATTLLQEQRLSLLRETMTGLNNATNVMQALQASVNERTQTAAELAAQMQAMVSQMQSMRTTSSDDFSTSNKRVKELTEQVEALAKSLRSST